MHRLELRFLGPPRITLDGTAVEIARRKAVALLIYLSVTRQPHSRDTLAALFWPEVEQSRAYAYVRTTLWTLNSALGDGWIDAERDLVTMRPEADWWVDVAEFRALASDPRQDLTQLAEAASLAQDDFLAGFMLPDSTAFDEWVFFEQENLRRILAQVLETLSKGYAALGQFETAIPYAQRWVTLDTLHEPAHRQLIRLFGWAGQWSAALRQYQQCVSTLETELGAEPEPETRMLHEAIQARRMPDAPSSSPVQIPQSPRGNIPAQSTPFFARERELDEITALLNDPVCRLLTLVGQGGIGKTRLAIQVAGSLAVHYPDGVYMVSLAPVNAAEYIIPALTDALQFSASRKDDPKAQLLCYLSGKKLLLLMDNFEHLLDGADLLTELLTGAPQIKILVTSRERLQLQEEWLYEIHGLAYPDEQTPLSDVIEYGAVQMFVESGRRVRPDFALTEENSAAVRSISALVEGMPLGLLLASAWLQMLSPAEIAQEIAHSLDFLETSLRSLPSRHRSLRAVFKSSWERLNPIEQRVLSQLAIFRGHFQRDAAQMVADASLPVLLALVSKSLLHRDAERYVMHELLRQFAEEKLSADPTLYEQTLEQYTQYYAGFMRQRVPLLKGSDQIQALNEIEADIDNIRLAWMLAIGQRDPAVIRGLLRGLSLFYLMRSRSTEAREMFTGTVDYLETLSDLSDEEQISLAEIKLNQALAIRAFDERLKPQAIYEEVLPVLSTLEGDDAIITLIALGDLSIWPAHDYDTTVRLANKALELHDQWGKGRALHLLGDAAHHTIDYDNSQLLYQQCLTISRAIGDRWGEGDDLNMLGEVAYTLGDYPEAERLYRESAALAEAIGDRNKLTWCMDRVGDTLAMQGRYEEALAIVIPGIEVGRELGTRVRVASRLMARVEIAIGMGDYPDALHYYEQAEAAFRETDAIVEPAWLSIARCHLALELEDADAMEQFAHSALDVFEVTGSPWGSSAALHYLGEAARMNGDYDRARDYLQRALRLGASCRSIMLLTRYLIGYGELMAHTGQPERAVEMLALVEQHSATWAVFRRRAARLLDNLEAELPPDVMAAAQARGAARTVEDLVTSLLAEPFEKRFR